MWGFLNEEAALRPPQVFTPRREEALRGLHEWGPPVEPPNLREQKRIGSYANYIIFMTRVQDYFGNARFDSDVTFGKAIQF